MLSKFVRQLATQLGLMLLLVQAAPIAVPEQPDAAPVLEGGTPHDAAPGLAHLVHSNELDDVCKGRNSIMRCATLQGRSSIWLHWNSDGRSLHQQHDEPWLRCQLHRNLGEHTVAAHAAPP